MATQPFAPHDGEHDTESLSHIPADAGGPIEALVSGTVGDRCVNCGAPMSSDQRYCVVCGERRGAARFSIPVGAWAAATETPTAPATSAGREPRGPRYGSGSTLIAGVATLLLAILVGVLIGHNTANGTKTIAAGPTKIIRVGGGSAAPASSSSTPASGSAASGAGAGSASSGATKGARKTNGGSAKGKAKSSSAKKPPISKQQAAAAQSAASKVVGSRAAPPTVTVGQKAPAGTPGVNKKTGKFDGSFFGN